MRVKGYNEGKVRRPKERKEKEKEERKMRKSI